MNPPDQPEEPGNGRAPVPKIIWLIVAFLPSVVAFIFLPIQRVWPGILIVLLILNLFCCAYAGSGLSGGIKDKNTRGALMFGLIVFFFIANAGISLFVGCAATFRM